MTVIYGWAEKENEAKWRQRGSGRGDLAELHSERLRAYLRCNAR
jgi:hypothetical protein